MKHFKIPLQTEVTAYIQNKMKWPEQFCEHYAEKFWNHYQASGWKLSNGNPVKDWQACFNSQWKVLKYSEDIELLKRLTGRNDANQIIIKAMVKTDKLSEFELLDKFIEDFMSRPTVIPFEEFGKWYEFMKANKLLKIYSRGEVEDLKTWYNGDNYKCRCAVVQQTLTGYVNSGLRIRDIIQIRERLK